LERGRHHDDVVSDLVAYIVVAVPDLAATAALAPSLLHLVDDHSLRILDLVVVRSSLDGNVDVLELADVAELSALRGADRQLVELMTDHDIALASLALKPDSVGVVLLAEDRWAEPLSAAARQVGGQIVAGERISATRVETALSRMVDLPPEATVRPDD